MDKQAYDAQIDLEVEVEAGKAIPADDYLVKVVDTKLEFTKNDGAPMYNLTLEVQDGEYKTKRVWHRRPIMLPKGDKKGTLGFVKADVSALGIPVTKGKAGDVAKQIVRESLGRLVIAKVGFGRGDYADRNEVKSLLPADAVRVDSPVLSEEDF